MAEPRLALLTREDCGLCEDIARDLSRLGISFATIDIEMDEALEQRYGEAIPVLLLDGREIARAPLDMASLERALSDTGVGVRPRR
jgi:glutaredoxin